MYYVNKVVGWCFSPLGILFLGLGLGWALRRLRFRRLGALSLWGALALTWVLGCGVTTRLIGLPLETAEINEATLPSADAIVLLGGGMGAHPVCGRSEMFASADRVWMAARLFRAGKAPRIFVTGRDNEASTIPLLAEFGVPMSALSFADVARNTEEEAREICAKAKAEGEERRVRVLLVTSAWHMKRARMLFEHAGLEVVEAPTDYEMHYAAECGLGVGDFLPSAEALTRNGYALKEWVARACYWVKFRGSKG